MSIAIGVIAVASHVQALNLSVTHDKNAIQKSAAAMQECLDCEINLDAQCIEGCATDCCMPADCIDCCDLGNCNECCMPADCDDCGNCDACMVACECCPELGDCCQVPAIEEVVTGKAGRAKRPSRKERRARGE